MRTDLTVRMAYIAGVDDLQIIHFMDFSILPFFQRSIAIKQNQNEEQAKAVFYDNIVNMVLIKIQMNYFQS
uniref:Uncharacterized protein n=1 Tax=Anguilla anguilla TaxID=7936 RepID=A0A0E9XDF6_ANGAN